MIPKKASNSANPKDYRPISLTSNFKSFQTKRIPKTKQYNKQTAIWVQKPSSNRREKVLTIFFDIGAAFDKVCHKGLLYKLIKLKIPNYIISWIYSFLDSRSFCVRVNNNNNKSSIFNIETLSHKSQL